MDKAQLRGQNFYRLKNYQAAVECFSDVISRNVNPPLNVFDNRAATYTKLGDLQAALRDGRRMIELDRAQVKGYLRTGQILQLMGKNDVALSIYKYGLRGVPADDPDTKLLRGMYDKLVIKLSPPKAIDPLLILPMEIVEMIIGYMSFNNLVSILRVSKQWRHLIESMPKLWRHLDLSKAKSYVRMSVVRKCVERAKGMLTQATLFKYEMGSKQHDLVRYILRSCKELDYLEIRQDMAGKSLLEAIPFAKTLGTLILSSSCEIGLDSVCQVLATCKTLKRAEFQYVTSHGTPASWQGDLSNLQVLKLNAGKLQTLGLQALRLSELFEKIPRLRELTLQKWKSHTQYNWPDFSSLPELQLLDITQFQLARFPKLPPSLRTLDLTDCYSMGFASLESQENVESAHLTELTSFSVSSVKKISTQDLLDILEPGKGKLEKLDIGGCDFDAMGRGQFSVSTLIEDGYLANVVELGLRNLAITDEDAQTIAKHLPRLKILDLGFTKITGVGVKALVFKPGDRLQQLKLQHCVSVSLDAVELARSEGIAVQSGFPDNLKYGKRTRLSV